MKNVDLFRIIEIIKPLLLCCCCVKAESVLKLKTFSTYFLFSLM